MNYKSTKGINFLFTSVQKIIYLMVLQLPAHNPECIIGRVAINLDLGEALCCTACHPFLGGIII